MRSIFRASFAFSCALFFLTSASRAADTVTPADPLPVSPVPPTTQPAQTASPENPLPTVTPGQQVSALINGKWTNATFIEKNPESYTVSEVYPDWSDEIYPYSSVMLNAVKNPAPEELKPGMAIQVYWGNQYWPARVVSTTPVNLVVRWDKSADKTHRLSNDKIRPLPIQPTPKPGRTDNPKSNPKPTPKPTPDKFDMI